MALKFTIIDYTTDTNGISTVVDEPVGWDAFAMRLKRDKKWHGFFDFWDDAISQLQWHEAAGQILKAAYELKGVDAYVELIIEFACSETDPYESVYTGKFTFERYNYACGDECYVECGIENANCLQTFRNRYDQKVDLDSLIPIDECCSDTTTATVGGEFAASNDTITLNSLDGGDVADLTGLKPGDQITITGTASNNGTFTIVSVTFGVGTVEIVVEEALTDESDSSFTLEGCLFLLALPAYTWLNKSISLPPKKILQKNDWEMSVPYNYTYTDDLLASEAIGTTGFYYFVLPFSKENLTEIQDSDNGDFVHKELGSAPGSPLDNFRAAYDGYVLFNPSEALSCIGETTIEIDLVGEIEVASSDTIQFDGNILLYWGSDKNGWNVATLKSGLGCAGCNIAGDTFNISYTDTVNLQKGDRIMMVFTMANFQYTTGGGGGGPTDPFELTIDITSGSFKAGIVSECAATNAKVYMINETLSRITESYTCDCLRVKSDYFGRVDSEPYTSEEDGCGSLEVVTSGLKVRVKDTDKVIIGTTEFHPKFTLSMSDAFDAMDAIHNIGMGIEPDSVRGGDSEWLRIEPKSHFYNSTVLMTCTNIKEVRRSVKTDALYSLIKIGYAKWETENVNGLNDIFSQREYRTTLKAVRNTYERICRFIASDYALEITRRQYGATTKDWRYDNDTFIICLTNKFCNLTQFLSTNNILIIGVDDENRWNVGDQIVISGTAFNNGTFTINTITIAGGNTLLNMAETVTTEIDVEACYENATNPFRIVENDIVSSSSNLLYPDNCMNLRISPIRNLIRHMSSLLNSYRNYLTAELKFTSGTGNYIAQTELSVIDCVLEAAGGIAENADLSLASLADADSGTPLFWPELVTFEYPCSWAEYKDIRANPYGLIGFQCGDGDMEYGWIEDFRLKPYEGLAEFTLIPKIPTE